MKAFKDAVVLDPEFIGRIAKLKEEVREFAMKFPMPGFDDR